MRILLNHPTMRILLNRLAFGMEALGSAILWVFDKFFELMDGKRCACGERVRSRWHAVSHAVYEHGEKVKAAKKPMAKPVKVTQTVTETFPALAAPGEQVLSVEQVKQIVANMNKYGGGILTGGGGASAGNITSGIANVYGWPGIMASGVTSVDWGSGQSVAPRARSAKKPEPRVEAEPGARQIDLED